MNIEGQPAICMEFTFVSFTDNSYESDTGDNLCY